MNIQNLIKQLNNQDPDALVKLDTTQDTVSKKEDMDSGYASTVFEYNESVCLLWSAINRSNAIEQAITVKVLIEKLKEYNPNYEVYIGVPERDKPVISVSGHQYEGRRGTVWLGSKGNKHIQRIIDQCKKDKMGITTKNEEAFRDDLSDKGFSPEVVNAYKEEIVNPLEN